jgi:hypothetical protein
MCNQYSETLDKLVETGVVSKARPVLRFHRGAIRYPAIIVTWHSMCVLMSVDLYLCVLPSSQACMSVSSPLVYQTWYFKFEIMMRKLHVPEA